MSTDLKLTDRPSPTIEPTIEPTVEPTAEQSGASEVGSPSVSPSEGELTAYRDGSANTESVGEKPSRPGRLIGIDIARAFALIGMFTQHVFVSGPNGEESTGWVGRAFVESAGRASVLFFVLSGVSLSIIARRGSASAGDGALLRRGFLLLTGGFLLTATLWPASILQHYGLAFLLAPLLLRLGIHRLVLVTAAGLIGGPVLLLFANNWTNEVLSVWSGRSGAWLIENVWDILISGIYPMVLWIGFFTLGMLIGRIDLGSRVNLLRLAAVAIVATIGFGLVAAQLADRYGQVGFDQEIGSEDKSFGDESEFNDQAKLDDESVFGDLDGKSFGSKGFDDKTFIEVPPDWRNLYDVAGHSGRIGWTMQTGALAAAVLAVAHLLPSALTTILKPLAWMGSMSLTAYVVHILLVTDVYDRFVSEADWSVANKELAVLGLIGFMIAVCTLFQRLLKVGPLEMLLKHFTVRGAVQQVSAPNGQANRQPQERAQVGSSA